MRPMSATAPREFKLSLIIGEGGDDPEESRVCVFEARNSLCSRRVCAAEPQLSN